jgi:hypothetical protein
MSELKKRWLAFALALLLVLAVPVSAEAASRGVYYRPSLTFVTRNAPEDMMMYMELKHQGETYTVFLYREDRLWESYFRFYHQTATDIPVWYGSRAEFRDAVLVVETGGVETRVPLPEEDQKKLTMDDFFMLDLSDMSLQFGLPTARGVLLFLARIVITVTAAMLILLLFRYRWLKSWMTVLIVNLVCQSALSLMLMNKINFNPNLIGVQFLAMIGVLIVQIPLFWLTMNENGSEASVRYAFWSNLAAAALNHIFLLNCPL